MLTVFLDQLPLSEVHSAGVPPVTPPRGMLSHKRRSFAVTHTRQLIRLIPLRQG